MGILGKYTEIVREGLSAFANDPSYAIAIAQQAGTLATQQAARLDRSSGRELALSDV